MLRQSGATAGRGQGCLCQEDRLCRRTATRRGWGRLAGGRGPQRGGPLAWPLGQVRKRRRTLARGRRRRLDAGRRGKPQMRRGPTRFLETCSFAAGPPHRHVLLPIFGLEFCVETNRTRGQWVVPSRLCSRRQIDCRNATPPPYPETILPAGKRRDESGRGGPAAPCPPRRPPAAGGAGRGAAGPAPPAAAPACGTSGGPRLRFAAGPNPVG